MWQVPPAPHSSSALQLSAHCFTLVNESSEHSGAAVTLGNTAVGHDLECLPTQAGEQADANAKKKQKKEKKKKEPGTK